MLLFTFFVFIGEFICSQIEIEIVYASSQIMMSVSAHFGLAKTKRNKATTTKKSAANREKKSASTNRNEFNGKWMEFLLLFYLYFFDGFKIGSILEKYVYLDMDW